MWSRSLVTVAPSTILCCPHSPCSQFQSLRELSASCALWQLMANLCRRVLNYFLFEHTPSSPFVIAALLLNTSASKDLIQCELYAKSWIFFQPNLLVDPKLGAVWTVSLLMNSIAASIPEVSRLLPFLLRRTETKPIIISVFTEAIAPTSRRKLVLHPRILITPSSHPQYSIFH